MRSKRPEITRREFGSLHCLVNCAASYEGDIARNVVEISESDWNQTIDVNLNGYFRFAKYAIPLILQSGGGTIVNRVADASTLSRARPRL
jgi:NAD(P)-dependent dehydrogenase (short-subunit alcohol dehydrogenase family)